MKVIGVAAALAAALLFACAQARADVNANVSVWAEAGAGAAIDQNANDNGSGGIASAGWDWPLAPFPSAGSFTCPATGCGDRSGGATAAVDERAGVLRAGAGASILVGNTNGGGDAYVTSEASVNDLVTLSKAATVTLVGTVHGTNTSTNTSADFARDPDVGTHVSVGFCCRLVRGEGPVPLGGYDQEFSPYDGPVGDSFSIPVDLPAGDTQFTADLAQTVSLLIDGEPSLVLAQSGLADFTGTVTFQLVVPDDVVATSQSGLLPIVGGAPAPPSDTTAPTSTASVAPAPNAAGWNNGPVTVHISAADDEGGSGVASITAAGTTTAGSAVDVPVTTEGTTTITYWATDAAGNAESPHSVTVRIDETSPSVAYAGNTGTYTVDQQVAITCAADDALSGVASSTCSDVTGPAYTFGVGTHTYTAAATDAAGNVGSGQAIFTVVADPSSVARLTAQLVTSSAAYASLSPVQQAVATRIAAIATRAAAQLVPGLDPAQEAAFLHVYDVALARLARDGWLTQAQASTLAGIAATL